MYYTLQSGINHVNAISESVSGEMGYIQSGAGQFGIFVWSPSPVTVHARHASGNWSVLGETTLQDKTMSIYFEDYEAVHVTAASGTVLVRMSYIAQPRSQSSSSQTTEDISGIPAFTAADAGSVLSTDSAGNLVWVSLASLGAEAIREYQATAYVEAPPQNQQGGQQGQQGQQQQPGLEQHGAMVVLQGAQDQSYIDQLVASPQADNTYVYEEDSPGVYRIRADKFPLGGDNELYALLTSALPSISSIANGTDLVIRFEALSKGAYFGFMAQDDLELFEYSQVEKNSVLWLDQRPGSNPARVYTKNRTVVGSSNSTPGGNAVRFSKDAQGNLTVKWQSWNMVHGYYVDRVTLTGNATFDAEFDPTQPLRFFVYTHRQDAHLMRNLHTITE